VVDGHALDREGGRRCGQEEAEDREKAGRHGRESRR
jgi:hypothetical protein